MNKKILYNKFIAGVLVAAMLAQGGVGINAKAMDYDADNNIEEIASESDAKEELGNPDVLLSYLGDYEEQVDSIASIPQILSDDDLQTSGSIPVSYTSDFVTPIKNQGLYGTCWAFATTTASEAAIYKKLGENVDLSEWQLAYFNGKVSINDPLGGTEGDSFTFVDDGSSDVPTYLLLGGNQKFSIRSLASWRGYVTEDKAPYSDVVSDSQSVLPNSYAYRQDSYHLKNGYIINMTDREVIKELIMEYGACGSAYYHNTAYFNRTENGGYAEYCDNSTYGTNHAITIIGWDDNYSRDNFGTVKPTNNGAWLIQNSWGTGDYEKFWISYEDAVVNKGNAFFYDPIKVQDDYDFNYQYDGGLVDKYISSSVTSNIMYSANVYTANTEEKLKAVGFYTADPNYKCTISIYNDITGDGPIPTGASPAATVTETIEYAGYHTVVIPDGVALDEGTDFSVVIKYEKLSTGSARIIIDSSIVDVRGFEAVSASEPGQSFASLGGTSWTDMSVYYGGNCRIKAFTDAADGNPQYPNISDNVQDPDEPEVPEYKYVNSVTINKQNLNLIKGKSEKLTATVLPADADDKSVSWISDNEYVASVSSDGTVTARHPGTATIVVEANDGSGKRATCGITVGVPDVSVNYRTHIQNIGWESTYRKNGTMSGTSGEAKRLEAIQINVSGNSDLGIQYVTHCQDYGWLSWSANDEVNGTSGESKRLEAIEIKLTGAEKDYYDVYYRVHAQDVGWLGWAKNGEPSGTAGYSRRLEGIQIFVVKKGESIDASYQGIISKVTPAYLNKSNSSGYVPGADYVHVAYQTHVQNIGWQTIKYDGDMSGTSGKSLRLEGIKINLTNKDYPGGICYTTHVQNIGWQGNENVPGTWMRDGAMSGTSGRSYRLEAIRIALTGEIANHYDIYYRVHAQNFGWMGWARNGEPAGTAGYSYRLEGIEIKLVAKGANSPESTAVPFKKK